MRFLRNKLLIAIIIISLVLLVSIVITSHGRTRPTVAEGLLGRIISPVQRVVYSVGHFFDNTFSSLGEMRSLKKENEQLKEQIVSLQEENRRLIRYRIENESYEKLLDFKNENNDVKLIGANVSGRDPSNWFDVFTINKGYNDGVEQNDAIVVGYGYLVGKVIEVGPNYSKILALIDQRSAVSIVVNRTRAQGIAKGSSDKYITAIMPLDADIAVNDDICTSGYSTFPKDIYIGKVVNVDKQEKKLQKIVLIEPAVDFDRLEEVFVLKAMQ